MKKLTFLFLTLFCVFSLSSCKKDDAGITNEDSLKNTTWEMNESYGVMNYTIDISLSLILKDDMTFESKGEVSGNFPEMETEISKGNGTWRYEEPIIYFTAEGITFEGEIKGDKMYLADEPMAEEFEIDFALTRKK